MYAEISELSEFTRTRQ